MDIPAYSIEDKLPALILNPDAWESVCIKLPALREKNYILFASNTSDLGQERRWPGSSFRELALRLAKCYPETTLIFCGTSAEKQICGDILKGIENDRLINGAGLFTLAEFLNVVAHARMIVANDTGPMHIALALGVKTLALFGATHPRCLVPQSCGILYESIKEVDLWSVYTMLTPRRRFAFEKKYKTLRRASLH
jgi:ADP-heptose:LPS heptosyltransferase